MGLIPQRNIEEILEAADIVEVISGFVELKQSGSSWRGLSPFTNEKTPSFYVIPDKGIFKDFSSGIGGSVVTFLMEHEKLSYPEALKFLAAKYHVAIEEEEAATDYDQDKQDSLERMRQALARSQKRFRSELEKDERAINYLLERGITREDIVEWQIGYGGNEWQTIADGAKEAGFWHEVVEMGICGHKGTRTYDNYRHRITIPIWDDRHNLIGFGGRIIVIDPERKAPKYVNTKQSAVYDKSRVLFGLDRAKTAIRKADTALLVEGYLDVISLHRAGVCNVVASCGTALTPHQAKMIKRWAKNAIIVRDGDEAGIKAADRDVEILVAAHLDAKVVLMPDGQDPDDFIRNGGTLDELLAMAEDGVIWRLKRDVGQDPSPDQLQIAIQRFCETLLLRSHSTYHGWYIDLAAKAIKQLNKTNLRKDFKRIQEEHKEKLRKAENQDPDSEYSWLPEGVDKKFFDANGFYQLGKKYWFLNKTSNDHFPGTNFIINPLYHIHNKKDDKRLFELVREDRKTLLEIPSTYINQKSLFENALAETPGNFYFTAEFTQYHFRKLMISMGDEMPTAFPLNTLGQQDEGFFAFADGIAGPDGYTPVDEYGMVSHTWEDAKEDGESETKVRHFYLPAFSAANKDTRSDSDEYENERKLQFRQSKISFTQYCELFIEAHGKDKAIMGIAYLISSMFRDIFIHNMKSFPLLFCWGEKGSGKSAFSTQLQNFFFHDEQPFMLNAGTDVGFFRRLARVTNAITFFDEYTDNIDESRFQALKSSWNGVGREKGMMTKDNRTETTKVKSSLIVAGQYISTRDDHSLTSRSILIEWQKQDLTEDQKKAFDKLREYITYGVSSLVCKIIRHRDYVQANIAEEYTKCKMKFRDALNDPNIMVRIIENYAVLQAHVNLLHERLKLPFDREDLFELCRKGIIYTSSQIEDSEALSGFWSALQVLVEERMIRIDHHYKIDEKPTAVVIREGEKKEWENIRGDEILYIRPGYVYSKYVEYMHRQRIPPLSKNALHSYMRGRKKLFIGDQDSCRFGSDIRDRAWLVNYTELKKHGYELPFIPRHADQAKPEAAPNPYEKEPEDDQQGDLPF